MDCAEWYVRFTSRPSNNDLEPDTRPDLELYTTRTDAWGLLALSALLLILCDAVPLPPGRVGSTLTDQSTSAKSRRPYAVPAVVVTMAHHALTAVGSYTHYRVPSHYTFAMFIGVWGNIALIVSGVTALVWLGGLAGSVTELREKEAARTRRALGLEEDEGETTPVAEKKVGGHSLRKRS